MSILASQGAHLADVMVNEGNSFVVRGTLMDENGEEIPLVSLSTLTFTLYDLLSDDIINNRDTQTILNTNGGTFHTSSGAFSLVFDADDNVILGTVTPGKFETHYGLIEATWVGSGYWSGQVRVRVRSVNRNN